MFSFIGEIRERSAIREGHSKILTSLMGSCCIKAKDSPFILQKLNKRLFQFRGSVNKVIMELQDITVVEQTVTPALSSANN